MQKETNNILMTAAAGSGKTKILIEKALIESKKTNKKILMTCYTNNCANEITKRIYKETGFIPPNLEIMTWFVFLLRHGARPYQNYFLEELNSNAKLNGGGHKRVEGVCFDLQPNRYDKKQCAKYYLTSTSKLYDERIVDFVIECNTKSNGAVISRLSEIYSAIFIDESQDMSGYSLDFIKLLTNSEIQLIAVCDIRQKTYQTEQTKKNSDESILSFVEKRKINMHLDKVTLNKNHRSIQAICTFADSLFPEYSPTISALNKKENDEDGIFVVRPNDIAQYRNHYSEVQALQWNQKDSDIKKGVNAINFGASKGLEFERVLIYPTNDIQKWLSDDNATLKKQTKNKLYVAITRAKFSVAFVYDFEDAEKLKNGIKKFSKNITNRK